MASGVSIAVRGAKECDAALAAMNARINAATLKALKASQTTAKASVKSGMRGRPRWDHRGRSDRTGPGVSLHLTPHHVSKTGGPGKLTGHLYGAVGGVKRPKPLPKGGYSGGVGCGGTKSVTNNYRGEVEERYPYVKPGVRKAEPKMAVVWQAAWAKAMR
ncbi:hypothetical protein ACGFW5_31120 [Streptomyces sp. NPDC048416]|uniref:hypothetical protein n=1 Tax=Streptomyces sp. NPDC048416 TaxID=3365546 RepID=UPI0037138F3F